MKTRKTSIILMVALAVLLIGNAIAVVQYYTKGYPVNWAGFSMIYCCLGCVLADSATKKKLNKK